MKKLLVFIVFASFLFASSVTATFIGKTGKLSLELSGININYNFVGEPTIPNSKSDGILSKYAKSISFSINEQENNSKELLKFISKNDKIDLIIKTNMEGTLSTLRSKM